MNYDNFGRSFVSCNELSSLLYKDPTLDLTRFNVTDPEFYNKVVKDIFYADLPILKKYNDLTDLTVEEFDATNQSVWHMPAEYASFDITQWILDQCKTDPELQRVGKELLLYAERDLLDLLRYLKYMVDTFRKHNIVWGLGRGSSVASYVLYLIGVHKINSMFYDLDIDEFLR